MQHLLHRLFLFLFSPILIFVFGDDQQQQSLNSHLNTNTPHNHNHNDVFDINSKLPSVYHAPTRQNISKELYDELEELARVVDVSYCVGYSGIRAPFNCLGRCEEFPSFQLVETWNTGPYLSDSCGYIALSHPPAPKRIIVAFRGTYSIINAIADLSLSKQSYLPYPSDGHSSSRPPPDDQKCENCTVHSGFLESWTQAERLIGETVANLVKVWKAERGYELVLVGHSLGGAVAALAGLEFYARGFGPVVTTFGEPRVGNVELARYIDRRFTPETYRRMTHINDPVPLLPLSEWGFAPHQTEYYIKQKEIPPKQENILRCEGAEDKECITGGGVNPLQLFWSHRDYFVRLGVCLKDPRKTFIGKVEEGLDGVSEGKVEEGDGGREIWETGGREVVPEHPNDIAVRRRWGWRGDAAVERGRV